MNSSDFDRFLSENSVKPTWALIHPLIWNGYWSIHKRPKIVSKVFRRLGRKLHSRRVYWIGLSLYWQEGLKVYYPDVDAEEVYL